MAAAVETVITEEAYTIDIKVIVVKAEAMAVAKLVMGTLCFSSRGGRV